MLRTLSLFFIVCLSLIITTNTSAQADDIYFEPNDSPPLDHSATKGLCKNPYKDFADIISEFNTNNSTKTRPDIIYLMCDWDVKNTSYWSNRNERACCVDFPLLPGALKYFDNKTIEGWNGGKKIYDYEDEETHSLYFYYCNNCEVKNIKIERYFFNSNCQGIPSGIRFHGCKNNTVKDCGFDIQGDGIGTFVSLYKSSYNHIINCNGIIKGNQFIHFVYLMGGIASFDPFDRSNNNEVIDCSITNYCIYSQTPTGVFSNLPGPPIKIRNGCNNNKFINITINTEGSNNSIYRAWIMDEIDNNLNPNPNAYKSSGNYIGDCKFYGNTDNNIFDYYSLPQHQRESYYSKCVIDDPVAGEDPAYLRPNNLFGGISDYYLPLFKIDCPLATGYACVFIDSTGRYEISCVNNENQPRTNTIYIKDFDDNLIDEGPSQVKIEHWYVENLTPSDFFCHPKSQKYYEVLTILPNDETINFSLNSSEYNLKVYENNTLIPKNLPSQTPPSQTCHLTSGNQYSVIIEPFVPSQTPPSNVKFIAKPVSASSPKLARNLISNEEKTRISTSPNPFHKSVAFHVSMKEIEPFNIDIFNLTGEKVHTIKKTSPGSNNQKIIWKPNGSLSSGVYIYQMKTQNNKAHGKILYLK